MGPIGDGTGLGDSKSCHRCSVSELEMRLGNRVGGTERVEKVCGQPMGFSGRLGLWLSRQCRLYELGAGIWWQVGGGRLGGDGY